MSYPVFYVPAGDVLPVFFDSFDGGTGASSATTGLAVTDIEIYKDGSVTQRASDAGYTLLDTDGLDFDGITGINGFSIDTGDNTDAGFYTVGAWFTVVVSTVTIDAQTVSFIACQFRIMAAEGVAGVPDVNATHFADQTITAGAGVTLPATVASTTNITAGTITTVTNLTNAPTNGDLTAAMKASVNAEVLDVVNVDTFAEPTGVPAATTTLRNMLGYLYSFGFRNKVEVTSSKKTFYDDGDAGEFEKDLTDDATTYTESEANAI